MKLFYLYISYLSFYSLISTSIANSLSNLMEDLSVFKVTSLNFINPRACHGQYCGRVTNTSECGACPWGSRSGQLPNLNKFGLCETCSEPLELYDWLYLGFMILLPVLVILYYVTSKLLFCTKIGKCAYIQSSSNEDQLLEKNGSTGISPQRTSYSSNKTNPCPNTCSPQMKVLIMSSVCILAHLGSSLITIILFPPFGTFDLVHCPIEHWHDFYAPLFSSPGCVYEVVYPFISLISVYYLFSAICCLLVYLCFVIFRIFEDKKWLNCFYYCLYAYPILSIINCLGSGLLYYLFPHLLVLIAIIDSLYRFPLLFDYIIQYDDLIPRPAFQSWPIIKHICSNPIEFFLPICLNCFCIVYAVIGYFKTFNAYLILCLFPISFYICTISFTHPLALSSSNECELLLDKLLDQLPANRITLDQTKPIIIER